MIHPDTFVGVVALSVSLFVLGSAIFNWDPVYESRTPRWIEAKVGRGGARMVLGALGTILFLVGFYLLSGFAQKTAYVQRHYKVQRQPGFRLAKPTSAKPDCEASEASEASKTSRLIDISLVTS